MAISRDNFPEEANEGDAFDEVDTAIEAFLDGKPRASHWREMREILQDRRRILRDEIASLPPDDNSLRGRRRKLAELDQQIALVQEEETVAQFVEDSIRASVAQPE